MTAPAFSKAYVDALREYAEVMADARPDEDFDDEPGDEQDDDFSLNDPDMEDQ